MWKKAKRGDAERAARGVLPKKETQYLLWKTNYYQKYLRRLTLTL